MSSFTIKNFSEIEDTGAARRPGIEMRFARGPVEAEHIGVTLMRYEPNKRSATAHSHREQEEVYVVTAGSGEILLDGEIRPLAHGDVVRVSPGVVRTFAAGELGLTMIAVGSDRPEGGDGMPVEASWPQPAA